jgi:hypothetical protein
MTYEDEIEGEEAKNLFFKKGRKLHKVINIFY